MREQATTERVKDAIPGDVPVHLAEKLATDFTNMCMEKFLVKIDERYGVLRDRLSQIFDYADIKKDGIIALPELRALIKLHGELGSDVEVDQLSKFILRQSKTETEEMDFARFMRAYAASAHEHINEPLHEDAVEANANTKFVLLVGSVWEAIVAEKRMGYMSLIMSLIFWVLHVQFIDSHVHIANQLHMRQGLDQMEQSAFLQTKNTAQLYDWMTESLLPTLYTAPFRRHNGRLPEPDYNDADESCAVAYGDQLTLAIVENNATAVSARRTTYFDAYNVMYLGVWITQHPHCYLTEMDWTSPYWSFKTLRAPTHDCIDRTGMLVETPPMDPEQTGAEEAYNYFPAPACFHFDVQEMLGLKGIQDPSQLPADSDYGRSWRSFRAREQWMIDAEISKSYMFLPVTMGSADLMHTTRKLLHVARGRQWIDASTGSVSVRYFLFNTQLQMFSRVRFQVTMTKFGHFSHAVVFNTLPALTVLGDNQQSKVLDCIFLFWILFACCRTLAELTFAALGRNMRNFCLCSDAQVRPTYSEELKPGTRTTSSDGVYYDSNSKRLRELKDVMNLTSSTESSCNDQLQRLISDPFYWIAVATLMLHIWTLFTLYELRSIDRTTLKHLVGRHQGRWYLNSTMWNVTNAKAAGLLGNQDSEVFDLLNYYFDTVEYLRFKCCMAMLTGAVLFLRHTRAFGQLSLLVQTLGNAWSALVHFMIAVMVFLVLFGTVGWFMFGNQLEQFASIARSVQTCLNILFGNSAATWEEMNRVTPHGTLIFWNGFMVLGLIITLNIIIAIILEGYERAKHSLEGEKSIWSTLYHDFSPNRWEGPPRATLTHQQNAHIDSIKALEEILTAKIDAFQDEMLKQQERQHALDHKLKQLLDALPST